MIIHELIQGTDDWHQFRLEHDGASEAAVMLGLSKKTTRNELLRIKHTGIGKEFTDWVQENILDHGHEVEALARPIVEAIIGDDLYPVTCSDGSISASCDGLTMSESHGWEHKQWNESLAAAVEAGELPDEFMAQPQQCLMVTGAERWTFTVSDGTADNMVSMDIFPDPAWFERIRAGWKQFAIDLAEYTYVEAVPVAVAAPTMNLPAVSVQVKGSIALISNLHVFGDALKGFINNIPEKPSTDQEFADCKSAIGKLQDAQDALDAAEANALGQIATFDEMRNTKALYFDLARTTRLALEKLVTARELAIKIEITQGGKDKLAEHIAALNKRLGKPYMPVVTADFATAIKGKRTVSSIQNAVDTLLSQKKIESSTVADKIEVNLNSLRELAMNHAFLFSDTDKIVMKDNDDLVILINSRINEHKAAEAAKLEAERARIQLEEEAKAKATQDKINVESEAQRVAAAKIESDRLALEQKQAEVKPVVQDTPKTVQAEVARVIEAVMPAPAKAWPFPANREAIDASQNTDVPSLTLGKIGARLGFSLTADFLRSIGFEPAGRERAAMLYHESDWPKICATLITHIERVSQPQQQAA